MDGRDDTREAEAALIGAAGRGDREAFERLVEPYHGKTYAYALRLTADPDLAEDICQDALLKAFRAIGRFRGDAAFSTWLFRIVHTTFLDHTRRRKARIPLEPLPEDGRVPEADAGAVARFFEEMERADREAWLLSAIARLPPELGPLVVLRDLQDFSYEEIAGITDQPVGTVKSRVNRARQMLRVLLTESGPGDA
jgi:RNA polymerase sigma-70 factor (ECF subfamily)